MVNIGKNVYRMRLENNLSRKELAQKLGVTRQMISFIELGKRKPSIENLQKLSIIFHTTTDSLINDR